MNYTRFFFLFSNLEINIFTESVYYVYIVAYSGGKKPKACISLILPICSGEIH